VTKAIARIEQIRADFEAQQEAEASQPAPKKAPKGMTFYRCSLCELKVAADQVNRHTAHHKTLADWHGSIG
jgi:hypothetical protein